jgi:hypothetical protein
MHRVQLRCRAFAACLLGGKHILRRLDSELWGIRSLTVMFTIIDQMSRLVTWSPSSRSAFISPALFRRSFTLHIRLLRMIDLDVKVIEAPSQLTHRSPDPKLSQGQMQPGRYSRRFEEANCCTDRHRLQENCPQEMVSAPLHPLSHDITVLYVKVHGLQRPYHTSRLRDP